jgi:hypothetical protein
MTGVIGEGRHAGGRAYGYRPIPGKPGEMQIVPEEAAVIRRIFAAYVGGETPREIAGNLNSEAIPPPRGRRWNASTINGSPQRGYGLLHNAMYAGCLVWNRVRMIKNPDTGKRVSRVNPADKWQSIAVPQLAIVDADIFAAAQARKAALGKAQPAASPAPPPSALRLGQMRLLRLGHVSEWHRPERQGESAMLSRQGERHLHAHAAILFRGNRSRGRDRAT